MRAAMETIPATGQNAPPKSLLEVAMMLALLTADSITDPSIIILGAWGADWRPKAGYSTIRGRREAAEDELLAFNL